MGGRLPMAELQREVDETARLDLVSVNAAAQRYAAPQKATLLLVGDRAKIEAGIRELGLGEVVAPDAKSRPIKK